MLCEITADGLVLGQLEMNEVAFLVDNDVRSYTLRPELMPLILEVKQLRFHPRVSLLGTDGLLTLDKRFGGGKLLKVPGGVLIQTLDEASTHIEFGRPDSYMLLYGTSPRPRIAANDKPEWLELPLRAPTRIDAFTDIFRVEAYQRLIIATAVAA